MGWAVRHEPFDKDAEFDYPALFVFEDGRHILFMNVLGRSLPWHPLTDANADYEVLRHVRGGEVLDKDRFSQTLTKLWSKRLGFVHDFNAAMYEVGDYTRAACIVKAREVEDEHRQTNS